MQRPFFFLRVLGIVFLAGLLAGSWQAAWAQASKARIMSIKNPVWLNGTKAHAGQIVEDGDTVVTGKKGRCTIVFDKKNVIRIYGGTHTELQLNRKEKRVSVFRGVLASLARKLSKALDRDKPRFAVSTPTAVAGVRGTAFFIKVDNPDSSYICLCNGHMAVTPDGQDTSTYLEAKHHKAVWVTRQGEKTSLAPAKMLFHTDPEMESVAHAIGETIDWDQVDSP